MRQRIKSLLKTTEKRVTSQEWDIFIGSRHVGTVRYPKEKSAWFIRRDLVYSKGYPGNIEVQEVEI